MSKDVCKNVKSVFANPIFLNSEGDVPTSMSMWFCHMGLPLSGKLHRPPIIIY